MRQKCNTIRSTSQLAEIIPGYVEGGADEPILLRSAHYVAAACDLSDTTALRRVLSTLALEHSAILFIAEVSMTYMEVRAANQVIKLASKFPNAQFCLLEQWMPAGPHHPFASTMIKHFDKLNSPLKAPIQYQDSDSLRQRFWANGWGSISVQSLWNLWSNEQFLCATDRIALDQVEQFDEWEEFALFSSHYFLLVANLDPSLVSEGGARDLLPRTLERYVKSNLSPYVASEQLHRYSAQFRIGKSIICHGGLGTQGRLSSGFIYSIDTHNGLSSRDTSAIEPSTSPQVELICHTITGSHQGGFILAGGRTAPNHASAACFRFWKGSWQQIADLHEGRYRHSAISVKSHFSDQNTTTVLLFGGRNSSGDALSSWILWNSDKDEWLLLENTGEKPPARFAAAMSVNHQNGKEGHLSGGIGSDRTVLADLWHWELIWDDHNIKVKCTNKSMLSVSYGKASSYFGRFGASMVEHATSLYLTGGVGKSELIPASEAILQLEDNGDTHTYTFDPDLPHPLLVGHSLEAIFSGQGDLTIAITGGGAVCFSFGTYWNKRTYSISVLQNDLKVQPWMIVSGKNAKDSLLDNSNNKLAGVPAESPVSTLTTPYPSMARESVTTALPNTDSAELHVPSIIITTGELFRAVVDSAAPRVLKSLDLGSCTTTWNLEYLKQKIGGDRQVVVHSSSTAHMDFLQKNFQYKTMPFAEFLADIETGARVYLRSLSSDSPTEKPTKLEEDFPSIAEDFKLPPELEYVAAHLHSSPLRISGRVNMWLHFDVMANVLCQIRGAKRVVLFHPSKVGMLNIPHGTSSSKLPVFDDMGRLRPEIKALEPLICDLEGGDVLFIPALWPHAAYPTDGLSVAVNVFFRSLEAGYAPGRDTYGNRDIQAYETGRRDIQRILKSFKNLPPDFRLFYIKRLTDELGSAI